MNINRTIYVPYCGVTQTDLGPYWPGAKNSLSAAELEANRMKMMLADNFNESGVWEIHEHMLGDIPSNHAPALQHLFEEVTP